MKRYAHISKGTANIIEVSSQEDLDALKKEGLEIVDIESEDPQPKNGWLYDGLNFSEPLNQEVKKKTVYTIDAFLDRISRNKGKFRQIKNLEATNDDIFTFMEFLRMVNKIDLNNLSDWFKDGMAAFVAEGIFTQEEVDGLMEL